MCLQHKTLLILLIKRTDVRLQSVQQALDHRLRQITNRPGATHGAQDCQLAFSTPGRGRRGAAVIRKRGGHGIDRLRQRVPLTARQQRRVVVTGGNALGVILDRPAGLAQRHQ